MILVTLESKNEHLEGFKYFWMKRVTGFNPEVHCARCLRGDYENIVGSRMAANAPQRLNAAPGEVFYLCGVSTPYRWEKNAHLAFLAERNSTATLDLYTGDRVIITNARAIPFTDEAARYQYPDKGAAYLTCRNFQFGAQHFR